MNPRAISMPRWRARSWVCSGVSTTSVSRSWSRPTISIWWTHPDGARSCSRTAACSRRHTDLMASISNWAARHGHALISSGGHLARHGFATTLTVIVMGLALALPLSLDVLVRNVRGVTGDFSDAVGMSVYLKAQVSEQSARQLAQNLKG